MTTQPPWPDEPSVPAVPQPPYPQAAYPQPPSAPKKKSALPWILPWILSGVGLVVVLAVVFGVVLVANMAKSGKTQQADTAAASFAYPESWTHKDTSNVTKINPNGDSPAIDYVATDAQASEKPNEMLVYQATEKPVTAISKEEIEVKAKAAIDQGLEEQLAASQEDLVYMRGTSAFGCTSDFKYTKQPKVVQKQNLYGYTYGYTCSGYNGQIQGEFLVAYDFTGVAHRLTVEAKVNDWAKNKDALQAIVPSFEPKVS